MSTDKKQEEDKKIYPSDISFKCDRKIAYDSWDHIHPKGSKHDNSRNWLFNHKFYKLYFPKSAGEVADLLKVLDVGCAGGGFVRECINNGCFAMGLEGSDYSRRFGRAEWPIIPNSLHLCDVTKNFHISNKKNKKILKFHLITAWELLEHLEEHQIDGLIKNVKRHLLDEGLFIASVANFSDKIEDIEFHRTREGKEWWLKKFAEHGFQLKKELYPYFNGQYIRGAKEDERAFHLIMSLNQDKTPKPTKLTVNETIIDKWKGRIIQVLLLK